MPIYVYKNLTTGERFEIEQRITEPPLDAHPETGEPVKRLVQPVGIAFKGSGFYATDSRASSSSSKSVKNDASAGGDSAESKAPSGDAAKSSASTAKESSGAKATATKD